MNFAQLDMVTLFPPPGTTAGLPRREECFQSRGRIGRSGAVDMILGAQ
jgi:hypothetical protein